MGRFGCCGDDETVFFCFFDRDFLFTKKNQAFHSLSDLDWR